MAFNFYDVVFPSIIFMVSVYVQKYKEADLKATFPENPNNFFLPEIKEYDFIIIGAGASGSIVANLLSEEYEVLLLEAGGKPPANLEAPSMTFFHEDLFYIWDSIPQNDSRIIRMSQGKMLGGGSSINGMVYTRGNPKDYDKWGEISGDESWNYENVLEHYKANEECLIKDACHNEYGSTGPIRLEFIHDNYNEQEMLWVNTWHSAGEILGFNSNLDPNFPQREGFNYFTVNTRNGKRQGVYETFLKPILDRANLEISVYSKAKKIDFDENKRAVGVIYEKHEKKFYAKARKEIIVSGGTLNSPLVLMRSGIGPSEQLESAGIEVIVDLPGVGMNYQEHPSFYDVRLVSKNELHFNRTLKPSDIDEYLENGSGPLGMINNLDQMSSFSQAFITTETAKEHGEEDYPDIQMDFVFGSNKDFKGEPVDILIGTVLERPTARGRVFLDQSDPHNKPLLLDTQYLSNERDMRAIIEGANYIKKIVETQPFVDAGITLDPTFKREECIEFEFGTDDFWECQIRFTYAISFHPTSTLSMGKVEDEFSVVDSTLKVKGVSALRVIDNSIQPVIINSNVHPPALMIGRKGATMILEDYK